MRTDHAPTRPPASSGVRLDGAHPLDRALRRLKATSVAEHLARDLRAGLPEGPGWLAREELLREASLDRLTEAVAAAADSDDPRLTGTFLLEGYAWQLVAPALGLYLVTGRLPDVAPDAMYVRLGDDCQVEGLAYASGRFATLDAGAPAGHPHAVPLPDEASLLAWFRRALVVHLEPVVAALAPRAHRSPRALWMSVEDCCSGALAWIGGELGDIDGARARADLLLGAEPPLQDRARFELVGEGAEAVLLRRRVGCCQSFRRPGQELCPTCPRARAGA